MENSSFLPTRIKFDRETIGGLADMFGQMPGMLQLPHLQPRELHQHLDGLITNNVISVLFWVGSGIGTGPGVIQDHYSPTMGRHRTNPHYNDHIVNGNSSHQPPFEAGSKPFIKPNQVHAAHLCSCLVPSNGESRELSFFTASL